MTASESIYEWLMLDDDKLWKRVSHQAKNASGCGGQKLNKTASALRICFEPLGIVLSCQKYRSLEENKRSVLRQLREEIALHCREIPPAGVVLLLKPYLQNGLHIQEKNPHMPLLRALLMAFFFQHQGDSRAVAEALHVTGSRLSRFINENKNLRVSVQKLRKMFIPETEKEEKHENFRA